MPNKFKRNIPLLVLSITSVAVCALGATAFSAATDSRTEVVTPPTVLNAPQGPAEMGRPAFPQHEKLVYRAKWLGITAGELVTEVQGLVEWQGRQAYRIEVTARTVGLCSLLYKIRDHYVSYLDAKEFYTLRHEVHRREGSYRKDAVTDFDQKAHQAFFSNSTDGSQKVYAIPANTQDTVTAAYYSRFLPLEPGRMFDLRVANSEKNYDLYLTVKSREKRSIQGKFRDVFHFQPYARLKGKPVREGRVSGYISADSLREPVLVIIKAPVFTSLTATLIRSERE